MDANQLRAEGRVRILRIASPALFGLCTRRDDPLTLRVLNGVPPNAELIGVGYDWERDTIYALAGHESFDPTPEGQPLPAQPVVFQREVGADYALAYLARTLRDRAEQQGETGLTYHDSFRGWHCPCCEPEVSGEHDTYYARHAEGCPLAAALALAPQE